MAFNLSEYEPVEARIERFYADHPDGRILTDLIAYGDGSYIVKASAYRDSAADIVGATGFAQENVTAKGVNSTSALENCETSAIGRALANLGYAPKGQRPSREEMSKAQRPPAPTRPPATDDMVKGWVEFISTATMVEELNLVAHEMAQHDLGSRREEMQQLWLAAKADLSNG